MEIGWITEKPNRYPIFLKTDTEYRTDIYKNRPKKRKPTPTENTDTDPPLKVTSCKTGRLALDVTRPNPSHGSHIRLQISSSGHSFWHNIPALTPLYSLPVPATYTHL